MRRCLKALEGHRLIFPGASSKPCWIALAESQLELSAFYEVQRSSTAVGLVAAGAGIAVAPRLAWQASYPGLRVVTLHTPTVRRIFVAEPQGRGAVAGGAGRCTT